MVLIQVVAATLLLLGSALIFRALVALDVADQPKPARPRPVAQRRKRASADGASLPRAA